MDPDHDVPSSHVPSDLDQRISGDPVLARSLGDPGRATRTDERALEQLGRAREQRERNGGDPRGEERRVRTVLLQLVVAEPDLSEHGGGHRQRDADRQHDLAHARGAVGDCTCGAALSVIAHARLARHG